MQTFETPESPPRERSGVRRSLCRLLGSMVLLALPMACIGEIGAGSPDGATPGVNTPGDGAGDPGTGAPGVAPDKANTVLRRLNRAEYNNTVRDLLGTSRRPADKLPSDETVDGFDTVGEGLSLSLQHLESLEQAATELIDELFGLPAGDARRRDVLSCQLQAGSEETCARQILSAFARRAFRRPVSEGEISGLLQLARKVSDAGNGYDEGLKAALRSILLSPHFLYMVEKAPAVPPGESAPLGDHELATRLSYFLWSSMPDAALFAAAEAGGLADDSAKLAAEVERMLTDGKAVALTENFVGQWLTLRRLALVEPDPKTFPDYDVELRNAAVRETELFFRELLNGNAAIETLLTADFTFVNQRLGQHYGMPVSGSEFLRVSLAGTERVGLLSHASFLMANSHPGFTSPTKRGAWVLEQLLCSPPPPVPPDLMIDPLAAPAAGETVREKLEAHRAEPRCAGCHALMDPIGLGLEDFDAIGGYRDSEDASGVLQGTSFSGVRELAALLSQDARLQSCFAQQLLTYAVGRSFHSAGGHAYAEGVVQGARAAGQQGVLDLLNAVVKSDAFRTRRGE
ncbi:DUF1592 domain-containing protein [Sorangium atrum]|uniref:DUF1592 domain-containing protein n=1 Tax=Sorangium atrum TaxID=2995308 RepID=A0ABT5BU93_9BACT|nr:DUF1592 domain-containing protein [Sorangium aterium]MDC0677731.1 DUF1592 domain-containing protein [Sorangium aterium]